MPLPLPRNDFERTPLLPRPRMASRVTSGFGPSVEILKNCNVFGTILTVRQDIIEHIDSPVTWEKLQEPEISFAIVRPLTAKYIALNNIAIVYCLLSNRLQFLKDSTQLPHARLNTSRASLCELLSIRLLNHYAQNTLPTATSTMPGSTVSHDEIRRGSGATTRIAAVEGARQRRMSMAEPVHTRMAKKRNDELVLAHVVIAPFHPFAGAPAEVIAEEEMEGRKGGGKECNALELAIVTEAKNFISCVSCQKVMDSVWSGRISYTPSSWFDIIPDRMYKQKAISLYDVRKAPLLDHYRLRVPRYRMILEFFSFMVVFCLAMVVLSSKENERMTGWEICFMVYTTGWALDRFASTLEHGWRVFAANLWNGIDAAIIVLYMVYLPLRIYGVTQGNMEISDLSLSILSCESSLLFPRLAFYFLASNVLVMSLRAMLAQFGLLMFAAIWIFLGFWHALYTLDEGNYGVWDIAKYMVNIWFGLDATGFELSTDFHPWLGPTIFFIFACLSNTLFITVVVAILSTTFAELNVDAKAEFMYRSAVGILEGVKSDSLFSFQPPLNIIAFICMLPASWLLTPRAFHRTHVFFTRLTNFPVLLLITLFERLRYTHRVFFPNITERIQRALPKRMQEVSLLIYGAHGDIEAVFDYAPDTKLLAESNAQDAEWEHEHPNESGIQGSLMSNELSDGVEIGKSSEYDPDVRDGEGDEDVLTASPKSIGISRRNERDDSAISDSDSDSISDGQLDVTNTLNPIGPLDQSQIQTQNQRQQTGISFPRSPHAHFKSPERPRPDPVQNQYQYPQPSSSYVNHPSGISTSPMRRLYGPRSSVSQVVIQPEMTPAVFGDGGVGGGGGVESTRGGRRVSTKVSNSDGGVPGWVREMQACLKGIEERQSRLEAVLGERNKI